MQWADCSPALCKPAFPATGVCSRASALTDTGHLPPGCNKSLQRWKCRGLETCWVPSLRGQDAEGAGGGWTELLSWARNTGPQVGQGVGLNLISCGDDTGVENPSVSRWDTTSMISVCKDPRYMCGAISRRNCCRHCRLNLSWVENLSAKTFCKKMILILDPHELNFYHRQPLV